ncbi:hypothetical protein ADN00_17220 [Ornatilinea apprima]|uniref:Flagellar protein FliL n=1 Tax=Ornatilinea apprima TaxID=1134406 RepID=A0A0P6WR96_9CHLR|nr:flagellar basal body-associated FliL family protein [Ornatilinea apprima]KPL71429.1 hypothetical protein ADN00_17220 [Ornatilinea apprima]
MEKVSNILSLVLKILAVLVLLITAAFSMATAYIMFAPDDYPKPFYLQYLYPTAESGTLLPASEHSSGTVAQAVVEPVLAQPGSGVMINTGTKIINLTDPSGRKYIRVAVVLEFNPPAVDPEAEESGGAHGGEETATDPITEFTTEITAKLPVIDDNIITLLSSKSFEQLYTAEGKEGLRNEIRDRINQALPGYTVIAVYFTEFVVE